MRILIIEDNQVYIDAAKAQLGFHNELTICSSYDEVEKIFAGGEHRFEYRPDLEFPFDVVLTGLFLSPSPIGTVSSIQINEKEEDVIKRAIDRFGAEVPYGLVFALAAMRRGVPVAIVSDKNHTYHPINWALDLLGFDSQKKIEISGVKFVGIWSVCFNEAGNVVKDWKRAFMELMIL